MITKPHAKPFLKWAGGKSQLLEQLKANYPQALKSGKIKNYYEPFLGGGAVFFHIINHYPVENFYLLDINEDIILVYQVIQKEVNALIKLLETYQNHYLNLEQVQRKAYFYQIREQYNQTHFQINYQNISKQGIFRAAQLIFLNKTCFNGLFRNNQKGAFNVPSGDYKNPRILDKTNLINVSRALQAVVLKVADFSELEKHKICKDSFIYFDPPYHPISPTSNFTTYNQTRFDESAQIRLANTFKRLDRQGIKLMLSNSDPKNIDENDHFFEIQYKGFHIQRISANRMINSVGSQRGKITELLITNY
jgi:DNA adenine methylase